MKGFFKETHKKIPAVKYLPVPGGDNGDIIGVYSPNIATHLTEGVVITQN